MGRRKITIKQIPDVKLRHITFNKRKNGLFKKAAELSVLCDLNLLLVCEDGLGNIIQFSKNKLSDIGSFLSQCNYSNIVDLTSEDYPDFARINKKKEKDNADHTDNNDTESGIEDEPTPQHIIQPQKPHKNARTHEQMEAQHKETARLQKKSNSDIRHHQEHPIESKSQRIKQKPINGMGSLQEHGDPSGMVNQKHIEMSQKKNKNKMNLRLNIPKQENAQETQQQTFASDIGIRMPQANNLESLGMPNNQYRKNDLIQAQVQAQAQAQAQARGMDPKQAQQLDFTSPAFMPYMDFKRLGSIYEPPMSSPFKFYQNSRMEPLSSVLKGISPFTFQIGTPLIPKMNFGEVEALDTANALRYMNRASMGQEQANSAHSHHSNKVFTFQPEEAAAPTINQMQNRNEMLMGAQGQIRLANPLQMQDYVNLPSNTKSEPEYELNLPPDTLSARRFNFEGYFKDFEDNGYGELRKKYKMS